MDLPGGSGSITIMPESLPGTVLSESAMRSAGEQAIVMLPGQGSGCPVATKGQQIGLMIRDFNRVAINDLVESTTMPPGR